MTQPYKAPPNHRPFSNEGLEDLANQCLSEAKVEDSALLEMAGLAIIRLLGRLEEVSKASKCARCKGTGQIRRAWNNDYITCDSCDGKGH